MPFMIARAFAEMINLPMYEQVRILLEQKYPKRGSSVFKIPYYKPALDTIKKFYRSNRNGQVLTQALINIRHKIHNQPRLRHNTRVIKAFRRSTQSARILSLTRHMRISMNVIQNVTLKLYFDVEATKKNNAVKILYNFRDVPIDGKIATDTINVVYQILQKNSVTCRIAQIEYVDLKSDKVYRVNRPSVISNRNMIRYARIVKSIWNTI